MSMTQLPSSASFSNTLGRRVRWGSGRLALAGWWLHGTERNMMPMPPIPGSASPWMGGWCGGERGLLLPSFYRYHI